MTSKQKTTVAVLAFVIIMVVAVIVYNSLSDRYSPGTSQDNQPSRSYGAAADFVVYSDGGSSVRLSDFKGKPVVINFWATWCPPCKEELPYFEDMYKKYGDDVEFMMVNLTDGYNETVEGVKEFVSENGYSFPVYYDTDMDASYTYAISAVPVTVWVDSAGNLVQKHVGMISESMLEAYIKNIL